MLFDNAAFGFEGRIWDLIISVPDHCLSFYFSMTMPLHVFFFPSFLHLWRSYFLQEISICKEILTAKYHYKRFSSAYSCHGNDMAR